MGIAESLYNDPQNVALYIYIRDGIYYYILSHACLPMNGNKFAFLGLHSTGWDAYKQIYYYLGVNENDAWCVWLRMWSLIEFPL